MITIRPPQTDDEWKAYYHLRFTVLREPWNQPQGSEVLPDEASVIHAAAYDEDGVTLGVARLQFNDEHTAQVRCVAVAAEAQGKGVGKKLMTYLENLARQHSVSVVLLEARENAVPFYKSLGYTITKESYLLFNEIQHFTMNKEVD